MSQKKIMLGNEAIARGAYEAGVKVSAAYPGTPSTEISESIVAYPEIYAEWSPNEKVAMEVAIGASISGVRAMASMKHVGVNVASDPLYTISYGGVNGGLVLAAADDPGLYSSQNEQDTRCVARAAQVPVLEPSDSQEAKDYMKFAFELSERYDTPVILRTTTRLSHSRGMVSLEERVVPEDKPYQRNIAKFVMMPGNAKNRHVYVEERMNRMAEEGGSFFVNRMEMGDTKIGFITCGIAYHYIKEICPDASILKLGLVNPLPQKMIQEFASKVDKLYIFEELEPVIEEQVKSWGIQAIGKEVFTRQGEYSSTMLAKVLEAAGELPSVEAVREAAQVPARPPILCPGCPHRSVFSVLNKLKIHGAGDIGCYTLGAVAPLSVIDTTVCMGASISTLHGMEKAKGKDYIKNWVAVIGDSTFMHTGINSLMNMVYNQSTGTVIILDNSTTGMTGHQDHAATGKTLMGQTVPAINIMGLCKSLGIASVTEVNAFDLPELTRLIKEETAKDSLSVIITKSPCVLLKGVSFPNKCVVLSDPPSEEAIAKAQEAAANLQETAAKPQEAAASPKESSTTSFTTDGPTSVYAAPVSRCKKCGACLRPGCPALTKKGDGTVTIDKTMCNGCGLCMQLCPFGAIGLVSKEEGGALA